MRLFASSLHQQAIEDIQYFFVKFLGANWASERREVCNGFSDTCPAPSLTIFDLGLGWGSVG
jgi:hypothetical protein